jgi:hypothetical protein
MPGESARRTAVDRLVHEVEFYGDDGGLSASVGSFLGGGLAVGCPAVVVATPQHQAAFRASLGEWATEGDAAQMAERLEMVDAGAMLRRFLTGDRLDRGNFRDAASDLIGQVARPGEPVWIYTDTMALLWDAGQVTPALDLEELWNRLMMDLPFSLLCGYPARLAAQQDKAPALEHMCRLHSGVVSPPVADAVSLSDAGPVRSFPPEPASARQARRFVLDHLGPQAGESLAADAALVTAELTVNAVLHARSTFTVAISHPPGGIRISVGDAAPLRPGQPLPARPGHGLDVVTQLTVRWAVRPWPGGKVVWAELRAASP